MKHDVFSKEVLVIAMIFLVFGFVQAQIPRKLFPLCGENGCQYIDQNGNIVIQPKFDSALGFKPSLLYAASKVLSSSI